MIYESDILKSIGNYNDEEIQLFEREVKERVLQKDEILQHEAEVAKSVYFLLDGAIYQRLPESDENSNIVDLHLKNSWFLSYESFLSQTPSNHVIVAFKRSIILELSIESIHYLIGKSASFLQINKILAGFSSKAYLSDNLLTPLQKYQFIEDKNRDLLNTFPLKMIASYLKVTPETLSRVRKNLVKKNS